MHLIESYAASSGLQVDRPFLYEKYFPIPWEKYILLHAGAGQGAKQYEYFSEVVEILRDLVPDYEIIQIGGDKDPYIPKTVNFLGKTTIHQTAYLIRRASLLIGNDSCNVHIASGFDIPIVGLYGSTTVANHGPYFSSEGKTQLLVGDLAGKKPSYNSDEYPKVINSLKPEEVVKSAVKLLGRNPDIVTRKSLYFGSQYNAGLLELIPDCLVDPSFFPQAVPLVRMDYYFNEDILARNLSARPYRIITDKPINSNILRTFKGRIAQLIYDIPSDYSVGFISEVRKLGINFILCSILKENKLADAKLDFFDYGLILERQNAGAQVLKDNPQLEEGCKYKTNKLLLANNKFYLNKVRWQEDKPTLSIDHKTDTLDLTPDFLDFAENYYIYKE
jgi:hypothetical protein